MVRNAPYSQYIVRLCCLLGFWCSFVWSSNLHSQTHDSNHADRSESLTIQVNHQTTQISISEQLPTYIADNASLNNVLQIHQSARFSVNHFSESIKPSHTTYWHQFVVESQLDEGETSTFILSLKNPIINHLTVYLINQNNAIVLKKNLGILDPVYFPNQSRGLQTVPITLSGKERLYVYLEKQSVSPPILLIELLGQAEFEDKKMINFLFWGGIIAFLVGLGFYNSAIYAMSRTSAYSWYLAFYFLTFIYFGALHGYGSLLWNDSIQRWLATHMMTLNFLLLWLIIRFSLSFLNAKENAPKHYALRKWFDIVVPAGFFVSFFVVEYLLIPAFSLVQAIGSIYTMWMAIKAYQNGYQPARFFIISWSFILIGAAIGMLTYTGVLATTFITMHAFFFGAVIELILLSIALADRIRHAENLAVVQAYTDPRTLQPNFSFFRSHHFSLPQHTTLNNEQFAVLLIQVEGVKNLLGLFGPNRMELGYQTLINKLAVTFKQCDWVIQYPLNNQQSHCMITLPGNHVFLIVKYQHSLDKIINPILDVAESPIKIDQLEARFNFRIGISTLPHSVFEVDHDAFLTLVHEAYRKAQLALIHCEKHQLRSTTYDNVHDQIMREQEALITDLRRAIHDANFTIYIQPQFSMDQLQLRGGEVLVRWIHEEKGMIPPFKFIPLAEQTGNIYRITEIVIKKSFHWLAEAMHQNSTTLPSDFHLSINLSVHDIYRKELVPFITSMLTEYSVEAKHIIFEVTESAIMKDHQRFLDTIDQLHELGFRIAIDDFGTGYSSMSYMQKMNADVIKVDRSFVKDIHESTINQRIVSAIIQMAHSTDAFTVAEGIENEQELKMMRSLGANYIQGFLTGKPVPSDDFIDLFSGDKEIADQTSKAS